ncbi:6-phosphogluconate dehydratase [Peptostreptococcus russellii]|uniref:6-phosphogluconate dehydratase n=1 Tax=Peptostreptococcus russellii TaxID=215200 RepID=A0A2P7PYV9_9FIRM|nr:DegV family protein [Peptostreptococcus russellii]PSJ30897.1 6-phosphogluconate dehydratase [Peptostreptococcus russellii]
MEDIKIVCDSLSDITQEYIDKYDLEFIPLNVMIEGEEYKDRVTLSSEEFYRRIREDKIMPKTSQITYADFYNVFDKYTKEGKKIIYISAAASATGTMQSAMLARNEVEGGDIRIIDSNTLCYGIALLVIRAAELREEGKSLDEIVEEIERIKDDVYVTFSCDDLEYLKRGGRISGTKAMIGTVLNIKPLCIIKDGIVDNVANARGKRNVATKLVEIAKENGIRDLSDQTVFLGYTDDLKERERLEQKLIEEFNPKEIKCFLIGCGIGTHGGPGITGFICYKNK